MKKLLVFVVLLAVGAGAAYHFGYLDRLGLPWSRTRFIPKDAGLLAYLPPDTRELMLVQSTQFDVRLSAESRERFEREVKDFHARTGIHTVKDVDAVAATFELAILRGRFDWKRLAPWLESEGYTLTELGGVPAAVKARAVDVALDGHYLLVGPQRALEGALSRKQRDEGLRDDSALVKTFDTLGWKHAVAGVVVSGSPLTALGEVVGLRAESLQTTLDQTPEGTLLSGTAVTGGKAQGQALRAALDVMRQTLKLGAALDSSPESRLLLGALDKSTLESDDTGRVQGTLLLPESWMDEASAHYARTPLPDALRGMSLPSEKDEPTAARPPPPPSSPTTRTADAPAATRAAPVSVDWKPPVLGLVLLTLALVTVGAQSRSGLFNVLFHPLFLLPFLVTTMGVFVFRWTGHAGGVFDVLARPMPEWHRFVSFPVAVPVALSAALPLLFTLLAAAARWLRPLAAGLAVGFSAFLAVQAISAPPLPLIPPAYTLYWYAGHAILALVLARLIIPRRDAAPRRAK